MKAISWVPNTEPLSKEWHAYRRTRITSTDVSAIVGYYCKDPDRKAHLCRWKTAYQVWARLKHRHTEEDGARDNPAAERGRFGEELALGMFEQREGKVVERTRGILQHPEIDWLCATPDGVILDDEAGAEVKCPMPQTWYEWNNGTPLRYKIQGNIAAMCGDLRGTYFLVAREGVSFEWIPRNPSLEANLVATVERFLDEFVRGDKEPEPYDFDSDAPVMSELLKRLDTNAMALSGPGAEALIEFRKLRDLRIRTVKAEKAAKLIVADALKSHGCDVGVMADGSGVSWKLDARGVRKLTPLVKVKREDVKRVKR